MRVPAERIVRHPLDMPARAKCSRHQTWHDGCHACTIAQGVRMDVYAHDLRQHVANKIARVNRFGR